MSCKILICIMVIALNQYEPVNGQIFIECNGVAGKPFGTFGENINRDGIFGTNIGLFYGFKKRENLTLGLQFHNMPYDESSFSDLQFEDNLYIRQKFKTKVSMQSFHGVIRIQLNNKNKMVRPYLDGIMGFNRFYGRTRSENAFFTADTNNDGKIDGNDGAIKPEDLGITTSVELAKSTKKLNHNSLSPSFGLGIGLKIKVIKSLYVDSRIAYIYGIKTSYYDYGSQDMLTNSIDNFVLVESGIPILLWSVGLSLSL